MTNSTAAATGRASARRSVDALDPKGKRVFVRADFNVPTDDAGAITDDRRIRGALPTIESLVSRGAAVVVASHFGRPAGTGFEAGESLRPVFERLRQLLAGKAEVLFAGQVPTDDAAKAAVAALKPGQVLLLENLRFEKGEKKGDPAFASRLADLADIYVNDAFGCSHRGDASMLALPKAMRAQGKPCVAGMLLEREIKFLSGVIEKPVRPFVAIVGGAKVSDKLAALRNLCQRVDSILVGGAMAYTFLKAGGTAVGRSRVQDDMLEEARSILAFARERGCRIELPSDHVCADALAAGVATQICVGAIPDGLMGLDIGPDTVRRYSDRVASASTILWNGPVGAFETAPFDSGTSALAKAVSAATAKGAISVAGGGDTAAAVEHAGLASGFSHISTGGGASLEMLEGKRFECIDALGG